MVKISKLNQPSQKGMEERLDNNTVSSDMDISICSYYQSILSDEEVEKAILEYRDNMDVISKRFEEKTKLQGYDIKFLMFATMLQCTRIYLINELTRIEKANIKNGREDWLHDKQNQILNKFGNGEKKEVNNYYASLDMIITSRGVPYDATRYKNTNYHIFKGANHRFSTLGHDPIAGLIFGTANILTSTLTTEKLKTYHVKYDNRFKNPSISSLGSTIKMLEAAASRFNGDIKSIVAAVIKQLIHIMTDLYTPCGIQLPGANLILSKNNVEKLTQYVSTGDIIKVGTSTGISILINTIIASVHGSKLLFEDDDENFSEELYSIRTKKIIIYSNVIASSSNIIHTALSKNISKFDLGGFLVTCYRVFNDSNFIDKIKYEFLNSEVSTIYEEEVKGIELYY